MGTDGHTTDPEMRAYGPFVTSDDISKHVAALNRNTHAVAILTEAVGAHNGMNMKIQALASAVDMLNDTIVRLCGGMGITVPPSVDPGIAPR